jgi:alpha-tubulin suppressor-like RCC1 family protein
MASGVTAIAAGGAHSLAIKDGGVWAWGYNGYGELGDGTRTDRLTPVRIDPADLTDITAIAAGYWSSCALSADGSLWVWGDNSHGQLGLGDTSQRLTPTHLLPPTGYKFTAIDMAPTGADHIVAMLAAVPEPSTLALLATAAIGLLAYAWRRRKLSA